MTRSTGLTEETRVARGVAIAIWAEAKKQLPLGVSFWRLFPQRAGRMTVTGKIATVGVTSIR